MLSMLRIRKRLHLRAGPGTARRVLCDGELLAANQELGSYTGADVRSHEFF